MMNNSLPTVCHLSPYSNFYTNVITPPITSPSCRQTMAVREYNLQQDFLVFLGIIYGYWSARIVVFTFFTSTVPSQISNASTHLPQSL